MRWKVGQEVSTLDDRKTGTITAYCKERDRYRVDWEGRAWIGGTFIKPAGQGLLPLETAEPPDREQLHLQM